MSITKNTSTAIVPKEGFKFGCDPELFVKNAKGVYVSAEGLIPGTKAEPHKVEYGAVQVDGMAAEFNIDPVDTFDKWNRNILAVMRQLKAFLPKGYTLDIVPAIHFTPEVYEEASEQSKELGCHPDYNAWSGEVNTPPHCNDPLLRTASGHIHVGWTEDADMSDAQHIMTCQDFVKQLDWYLGAWSIRIDPDPTRRILYGKAGAHRPKPYGVEYRVLSNFWLTNKERRLEVWNRIQTAIYDMKKSFLPDKMRSGYNVALQQSINFSTPDKALERSARYPILTLDPNTPSRETNFIKVKGLSNMGTGEL